MEKPAFAIRGANRDDAPGILECLADAFEQYRAAYTAEAFQQTVLTLRDIEDRLAAMCVLVAASPGGEVIGTVAGDIVSPEEGHIRGMAVPPKCHGLGVAGQLIQCVESKLREKGCSRITLDTAEVLEPAVRFYERHGFRRSGQTTSFFGMALLEYVKAI